jgi:hypothetical protein
MFWPNWLPSSGVQVVEETAAPLTHCYILHFILTLFLKYITIILLYAHVMGLVYILLMCFLFNVVCSCSE